MLEMMKWINLIFLKKINLLHFTCINVCLHEGLCTVSMQRTRCPVEGIKFPGTEISDACYSYHVSAEN